MASKKTCILCGAQYEYCGRCRKDPAWKSLYDTTNCRKIFNVCSDFYGGVNPEDLKEKLSECDLNNKETYRESIQNAINSILATTKKKKTVKKTDKEEISE